MINYSQAGGFFSVVNSGTKELSKVQKKLTKLTTEHTGEIVQVGETIKESIANSGSDIFDWVKLGIGIASVVLPPPAGPILGVSSALFFTFYNKYDEKEEVTNNYENNKFNELEFFQDALNGIENKIDEIAQFYDDKTYKILDGLSGLMTKQEPQKEVRTELQFLNYFYKTYYKNCMLLSDYPYCSEKKFIIKVLNQAEPFIYNLNKFVRRYLVMENIVDDLEEKSFFTILLDRHKQRVYF